MTALNWIQSHGVEVSLEGAEHVRLDGLDRLKEDQLTKVVEFAKQNKPRLLAELVSHDRGECAKGKTNCPEWQATGVNVSSPAGEVVRHFSGRLAVEREDGVLLTVDQEKVQGWLQ